jgi:hypothetical protein
VASSASTAWSTSETSADRPPAVGTTTATDGSSLPGRTSGSTCGASLSSAHPRTVTLRDARALTPELRSSADTRMRHRPRSRTRSDRRKRPLRSSATACCDSIWRPRRFLARTWIVTRRARLPRSRPVTDTSDRLPAMCLRTTLPNRGNGVPPSEDGGSSDSKGAGCDSVSAASGSTGSLLSAAGAGGTGGW